MKSNSLPPAIAFAAILCLSPGLALGEGHHARLRLPARTRLRCMPPRRRGCPLRCARGRRATSRRCRTGPCWSTSPRRKRLRSRWSPVQFSTPRLAPTYSFARASPCVNTSANSFCICSTPCGMNNSQVLMIASGQMLDDPRQHLPLQALHDSRLQWLKIRQPKKLTGLDRGAFDLDIHLHAGSAFFLNARRTDHLMLSGRLRERPARQDSLTRRLCQWLLRHVNASIALLAAANFGNRGLTNVELAPAQRARVAACWHIGLGASPAGKRWRSGAGRRFAEIGRRNKG